MKNNLIMNSPEQNGIDEKGKVAIPLLLWFLGFPGFVVILLWLFIFRS